MLTTWNKRADAQAANLLLPLTNDFMSFIVHHCIISLSSDGAIYDYFRSVQKSLSCSPAFGLCRFGQGCDGNISFGSMSPLPYHQKPSDFITQPVTTSGMNAGDSCGLAFTIIFPILHYPDLLTVTVYDVDHLLVDRKPRLFQFAYPWR